MASTTRGSVGVVALLSKYIQLFCILLLFRLNLKSNRDRKGNGLSEKKFGKAWEKISGQAIKNDCKKNG